MDLATYTTGLGNIKQESLKSFMVPIPDISIQEKIVTILDNIYQTIELNIRQIENYEKVKKDIIYLYTRGIEKKRLGDVTDMKIGGTPRRDTNEYWENGTNLWVSVSELNNDVIYDTKEKITDIGVKKSNVKLVKKDTVLMSFKMSLGKKAIAGNDLYTNEAIVAINGRNILNKYIYYSIDNFDFSQACSSIASGNLNKEKLENLLISVPPLFVQKKIVQEC